MKQPLLAAAIAVAVCALAACQRPATGATDTAATATPAPATTPVAEPAKAAPTDLDALAQRLVTQSAAVKEGEIVMITGRQQDAELMENIAVEVAKAGGYPMVDYSSDRLSKRLFFDVPDTYDSRPDALGAAERRDVQPCTEVPHGFQRIEILVDRGQRRGRGRWAGGFRRGAGCAG